MESQISQSAADATDIGATVPRAGQVRSGDGAPRVTIRSIQDAVCQRYGVTRADLLSRRRTRWLTFVRHVGYWLARNAAGRSHQDIAQHFERSDAAAVMLGCAAIDALIREDDAVAAEMQALRLALMPREARQ